MARLSKPADRWTALEPSMKRVVLVNQTKLERPRPALAWNVGIAALAAVGLLSLIPGSAAPAQALVVIPVLTVLLTAVLILRTSRVLEGARREGGGSAITDPLTGVATAASGEQVLALEFAAAQRGRPLAVALIRIERLQQYRTQHGKAVAAQLLRQAGRALKRNRRRMHLAARHSADEATFLAILSGSDLEGATVYATKVRRDLLRLQGVPVLAGVSVGIASYDVGMTTPRELIRQAAIALDRGSAAGGKIVVMSPNAVA